VVAQALFFYALDVVEAFIAMKTIKHIAMYVTDGMK
jgi:hypothetical protein